MEGALRRYPRHPPGRLSFTFMNIWTMCALLRVAKRPPRLRFANFRDPRHKRETTLADELPVLALSEIASGGISPRCAAFLQLPLRRQLAHAPV